MRVVDLFCGCGGLSLGFQNAGFEIVAAYDKWKAALEVYRKNFSHCIITSLAIISGGGIMSESEIEYLRSRLEEVTRERDELKRELETLRKTPAHVTESVEEWFERGFY